MADSHHPPLNYENSAYPTHRQVSTILPPEVSQCLKNARFLHLATINSPRSNTTPGNLSSNASLPTPHVSLMNYTFLPNYQFPSTLDGTNRYPCPVIIMTTNAQSLKTHNLLSNPRVSLLVHDWVSHRPPIASTNSGSDAQRSGSPPAAATRSSLASLLLNLNTSALSSISTTIAGEARFLESGSEEEKWCKEAHLANNTFEGGAGQLSTEAGYFGSELQRTTTGSNSSSGYIEGDDVRVVVVPVREGRISDFKGGVRDWVVLDEEVDEGGQAVSGSKDVPESARGRQDNLVNGIIN